MLGTATITYDLADLIGADFDARRTKVWVTTNVPTETVVDTDANKIRLGSGNGSIADDGTGSVDVWTPGTGSNPASWQTYVHVAYPDRNTPRGRAQRTFGPFTITASADLADLVEQQEMPPEYIVTVTSALSPLVGSAQAAATTASASATSAAASAAAAQAIVLADAEGAVDALLADPESAPSVRLSDTFATQRFARPQSFRTLPQLTTVSTFQTGHGWTPNVGTWTADTADYALGSQSIKTTTTNASATSFRKFALPAMDLSSREMAMLVKVDDPTKLTEIDLYVGKSNLASYQVVLPAKGGISANATIEPNTWTWVYFSWAGAGNLVGSPDRAAVTDFQIRVVANSASPVTVWVNAIGHMPRRQAFPSGVVSFACDDGRASQLTRMAPALDKYGYAATAYVIAEYLDLPGKISYDQLKRDLEGARRWEVAGHAYSGVAHDNGLPAYLAANGADGLDAEMRRLREWLQRGNHKGADLFAYPLGAETPEVVEIVSRYFASARQIVRVPFQTLQIDQPYRLRSYSMSSSDSLATAKTWVDWAVQNGAWLILTMHDIVDGTPAAGTEWNTADFQALVDYVAASGVEVAPVGAALDRITASASGGTTSIDDGTV